MRKAKPKNIYRMKHLLIILTLSLSSYGFAQIPVTDAAVNAQLVNLQLQTQQLMSQNQSLLLAIQEMQRISREENQTKKQAPNQLLYSAKLNELNQVKSNIVNAGKGLASNIKEMKHLSSSDYNKYVKNTTSIVQNTVQVYAQIQSLMKMGGTVIPANERLQALDSSFDILNGNLVLINSYNSILQGLNRSRATQKIK